MATEETLKTGKERNNPLFYLFGKRGIIQKAIGKILFCIGSCLSSPTRSLSFFTRS